ncbi:MAG: hypothetical protein ACRELB_02640, partial [Polyangiaceae bacterium]
MQSTQAPDPPHAVSLVPGRQVDAGPQQPATHGALGEHENVHRPDAPHPLLLGGQSVGEPHPHCPPPVTGSHTSPLAPAVNPAVHDEQRPPLLPQVAVPVPGWQVPPVAAEQHPPLQGCEVLHAVVQVLLVASHACPAGQSDADWQPHFAGDEPRHSEPLALPTQLVQAGWPVLHAAGVVPALHVPAALQQPPLHAEAPAPPQAVEHWPVAVSQAIPVAQSPGLAHEGPSEAASTLASPPPASTPASAGASVVASTPLSCPNV